MVKPDNKFNIIEYLLTLFDGGNARRPDGSDRRSADMERYNETALALIDFLNEIPGGFLIYKADAKEEIVYANTALLDIFKCDSLEEFKTLTGNSFKGIVHPDDLNAVEESIAKQIKQNDTHFDYVEYRIIRKDGVIRWVEDYGHYLNSETDGGVYYVFISDATDKVTRYLIEKTSLINEKRQNEKKLQTLIEEYDKERKLIRQEHLQRLEVIEGLSVNYDSILYADLDSNCVLPYRLSTRLERQFEKKLQPRELNWFLKDYTDVWVHPDDKETVAEKTSVDYIKKTLSDKNTYYLNYRCIQNGETQYLQLRIVNVTGGSGVSQVVMGYRNIDKEVLQEIKQRQMLETALKNAKIADVAKNTFLSNMSHDMRTPLNAIFGYVALARKSVERDSAARGYLDKIEASGEQILDLIDKVLEISYAESQDVALSDEPCDFCETVRETVDAAMPLAVDKGIKLTFDDSKTERRYVLADIAKLKQIFNQIIGNAVKYTESGGTVEVTVTQRPESKSRGFTDYSVSVKDTGIGIKKSFLPRIFDPFERENNTTSSGVYGPGLGLPIAKHFVEIMGGSIDVKSAVGKGSVFTVSLGLKTIDADRNDIASIETTTHTPLSLAGRKILIAEDNEINLEIETDLLQDEGFIIDSAPNGKIAVEKIAASKSGEYSLVLMDIQMPVMDGRRAAAEIRKLKDPTLANIPIIALSANAFESDKRESLEVGMNAHLTKPIDIDLLMKTIRSALIK